jgi:hypothetical protein
MLRENRQVLQYGFGVLALVSGFLLCAFLFWPYTELQGLFRKFEAEKDWLLHWNGYSGNYGFSAEVYKAAKAGLAVIFGSAMFAIYKLRRSSTSPWAFFFHSIAFFFRKLKEAWQQLPLPEKLLAGFTFAALLAVRSYLLLTMRIGQDEAASFMLFLHKGLPGILFYYPLPNNHIFYNLFCLPLKYIFADPYWIMQMPVFVLSAAGGIMVYLALRSVFPFVVTYFGVSGFAFSYLGLFYAVHGRGYFLLTLCSVFAAISIFKIYERKSEHYWLVFLLSSVAGFFTIPVFLYPFLGLLFFGFAAFIFSRNRRAFLKLLLSTFFAGIATILLYVPVIMGSGVRLLFFNSYVSRMPAESFFQTFKPKLINMQGALLGQESIGFFLWLFSLAGLLFFLVFRKRFSSLWQGASLKPAAVVLLIVCSSLPWVLLALQQVSPPDRVFLFKAFFDFLLAGAALYLTGTLALRNFPRTWYMLLFGWVLVFSAYETHKLLRMEKSVGVLDEKFDERLLAIRKTGARTIFANDIYYSGNLRYEYFKHGVPGFIIDEYRFVPTRKYDLLILNRNFPKPAGLDLSAFRLYFENSCVQIYLQKSEL